MRLWWILFGAWALSWTSGATAQEQTLGDGAAVRRAGEERTRDRAVRNVEQAIAKLGVAAGQADVAATALAAAPPTVASPEPQPGWFGRLVLPDFAAPLPSTDVAAAAERSRRLAATLRSTQGSLIASLGRARELPADRAVRELTRVAIPDAALTVIREGAPGSDLSSPYVISYSNENYSISLDYPSVGSLMYAKARDESSAPMFALVCSATLISANALLSAAHCFCGEASSPACKPPDVPAAGGPPDPARDIGNWRVYLPHSGVYRMEKVVINPDYRYSSGTTLRDLAVVVLRDPVDEVRPMPLAAATAAATAGSLTAVGFGRYSRPYQVAAAAALDFAGPSAEAGIKAVAPIRLGPCAPRHAEMLCWRYAGGFSDGSICSGDSGGSLLDGDGLLAAVLNGGTGVDGNGVPTCQTDNDAWATSLGVEQSREWIKRVLARHAAAGGAASLPDALNPFANSKARLLVDRVYPGDLVDAQADEGFDVTVPVKRLVVSVNASRAVDTAGKPFTIRLRVIDPTGAERCGFAGRQQAHVCELPVPTLGRYKVTTLRAAYQELQLGVVAFAK